MLGVGVLLFLLLLGVGGAFTLDRQYQQRVFPGVMLNGTRVDGLTYLELLGRLEDYATALNDEGIPIRFQEHVVAVTATQQSPDDPDLARELLFLDVQKAADDLYAIGRSGDFWKDQQDRARLLLAPHNVTIPFTVDDAALVAVLEENFSQLETPAKNAALSFDESGSAIVRPEERGNRFVWGTIVGAVRERIAALSLEEIVVVLQEDVPRVRQAETADAVAYAQTVLSRDPLTLSFAEREWTVPKETFRSWLTFGYDRKPVITLDDGAVNAYLDHLAKDVEIAPKEGKFSIDPATGKVSEFQASVVGRAIDRVATRQAIIDHYLHAQEQTVSLAVTEARPRVTTDSISALGIKEIIGVGTSNMKGSPKNRRHNIAVGARTLHGILIKPDEEFSLVAALGEIEASTGYLPELVIKGNRTIPEYGGGLCQIGTTTFRAAMGSALPITERRNHSYSVSYYLENGLPGTDATIYPPHPDLRFQNDTGHYILIQTRIEGDDITFEFWGTKDGRTMSRTKPVVSNRIAPPPTKIVETADLKPGERKCTEKPHAGLTASFDYTIDYPSGEKKTQTFASKYRPWQEVCLVGKAP